MSLPSQRWRLSLPPPIHLEGQGCGSMGVGDFEDKISSLLFIPSSSLSGSDSLFQLFPKLHQGEGASQEDCSCDREGSSRAGSHLSGLLQPHVCHLEGIELWRPILDLSHQNKFVLQTRFKMETSQSVLRAVRRDDWMVSIDLKVAYLQVPVHPESRKFLQFVAFGKVYQFKILCFGLSMAPQVFIRVMAPVSVMLHNLGVRLLRYLDNWLILASSRKEALWASDVVLHLCRQLGILINFNKSHLSSTQSATYLGMVIESLSLKAFLSMRGFRPCCLS